MARDDLSIVVRADTSSLASDLGRAAALTKNFARDLDKVFSKGGGGDMGAASFKASGGAAAQAKASYAAAGAELASFAGKAMIASGAFLAVEAGLAGIGSAIGLVKSSINMAAEVEQTTIAFETMLGSADRAATAMSDLRKFAAQTPFGNKEVTDSAKSLLAYGVAADQIIPTLKMIGTVGAGQSVPLKDMTMIYGTLIAQGQVYAQDVRQFTTRGINVNPGLAKSLDTTVDRLHKLGEEGFITVNEMQFALKHLANTSFAGMLEKQADSLKGGFEQLGDAWDMVKLKLGQTIVRESGLKAAMKDLEAFSKTIDRALSSPEFAQGVRFVSDAAKAAANLAYQFGRVGANVAGIGFEAIGRAFPGLQKAADSLAKLVQSAKDFHIDENALAGAALNIAETMVVGLAHAVEEADKLGESLKDVVKRLAQMAAFSKAPHTVFTATILKEFGLFDNGAPGPAASPIDNKAALDQWSMLKSKYEEAASLANNPKLMNPTGSPVIQARSASLLAGRHKDIDNFLAQFKGPDQLAKHKMFDAGNVPERIAPGEKPAAERPTGPVAEAKAFFKTFRPEVMGRAAAAKSEREARLLGGEGAAGVIGNALPAGNEVRPFDMIPPRLTQLADKLNDQFNPGPNLLKQLADMGRARDMGLISPDVYDKGRSNAIREVGDRLGLGGETKLAAGAAVGSAEDARIMAQFRTGGSSSSPTEQLLAQILAVLQRDQGASVVADTIRGAIGGVINITP
jgi:hypothetical protein